MAHFLSAESCIVNVLFVKCQTDIGWWKREREKETKTPQGLNSIIHAPLLSRLLNKSFFIVTHSMHQQLDIDFPKKKKKGPGPTNPIKHLLSQSLWCFAIKHDGSTTPNLNHGLVFLHLCYCLVFRRQHELMHCI